MLCDKSNDKWVNIGRYINKTFISQQSKNMVNRTFSSPHPSN